MRFSKRFARSWVAFFAGVTLLVLALTNGRGQPRAAPHGSGPGIAAQVSALWLSEARAANIDPPKIESKGESADESKPGEEKPKKSLSWFSMIMSAVAGLVLFIYGVTRLAQGLAELNTDRIRAVLGKLTTNRFAGIGTGVVATTLLESSSVTSGSGSGACYLEPILNPSRRPPADPRRIPSLLLLAVLQYGSSSRLGLLAALWRARSGF